MRTLLLLCLLFTYSVYSQKPACSCSFQGILSAGLAAGESSTKPIFQLSTGLQLNNFFTGIGAGLDQYKFKSIPLFLDGRYEFGKDKAVFVYANAGYNLPYDNKDKELPDEDPFLSTNKFKGGSYFDMGIGYRVYINRVNRLLFSAGYSQKRISQLIGYTYPCPAVPCADNEHLTRNRYDLGRIVAKFSWELRTFKKSSR